MGKLTIFDDNVPIATITAINNNVLIFARSSREWKDVNRWISQGFYRLDKKTDDYIKITPQDLDFLNLLAEKARGYDFSTEIVVADE